jgi:hypothetical protein
MIVVTRTELACVPYYSVVRRSGRTQLHKPRTWWLSLSHQPAGAASIDVRRWCYEQAGRRGGRLDQLTTRVSGFCPSLVEASVASDALVCAGDLTRARRRCVWNVRLDLVRVISLIRFSRNDEPEGNFPALFQFILQLWATTSSFPFAGSQGKATYPYQSRRGFRWGVIHCSLAPRCQ